MRFLGILSMIAGLSLFMSNADAQDEEIPTLGGSEAIHAIIGSTITFSDTSDSDDPRMIYIGSDNSFDGLRRDEIIVGKWFEKDHLFCIEHESPCVSVLVTGTMGFFINDSRGDSKMFTIEAGNQVDESAAK